MTKLLLPFLLPLCFLACHYQTTPSIKVMTWNIWHGGIHGPAAQDFAIDTANTKNVLKVIQQENPDILMMQETYCCGMDIAKEAGYPYSSRASSNLSIHSKYPIVDSFTIYNTFNAQAVTIDMDGQQLLCVNIWLHYLPDYFQDIKRYSPDSLVAGEAATRLKEITAILKGVDSLEKALNLPIIIGGDFNSGSHLDWVESTKSVHYDKVVEWPVSQLMATKGFTDAFRSAHPDPAKTLEGTWGFLSEDIISDRIDYIYYKGESLQTLSARIVLEDPEDGFFNSDHRAIISTITLE